MYLCRPSEASTWYCVIPGGYPPQDWQSLPCAGEELDSNPGLLICSQVRYHWATSPPPFNFILSLKILCREAQKAFEFAKSLWKPARWALASLQNRWVGSGRHSKLASWLWPAFKISNLALAGIQNQRNGSVIYFNTVLISCPSPFKWGCVFFVFDII